MRPPRHHHSYSEYLYLENYVSRESKHEFLNGDITVMTGGTPDHAAIGTNVSTALSVQLRGKPCRVFSSDLRIRIEAPNVATYPDVSVVCGHLELDPKDDKHHGVLNPILIVEVLSPSTAEYDCGEKLEYYKLIPSLREVVLVDHEQPRVAVWRKGIGGAWRSEEVTSGEVKLESIGCTLSVDEVYRNPLAS